VKPPKKTRLEIGFLNGEPEKAFFDEAHRILLGPYRSAGPAAIADRRRLMEFIALTLTYLKMMGAGDRFTNKLTVYYAALRDLDLGVTHPILKAKHTRKPPLGSEIWRLRAMLAVALDYLRRAKMPLEKAASKVANTPGITLLLSGEREAQRRRRVTLIHRSLGGEIPSVVARKRMKSPEWCGRHPEKTLPALTVPRGSGRRPRS
jgi:hypothetical protein